MNSAKTTEGLIEMKTLASAGGPLPSTGQKRVSPFSKVFQRDKYLLLMILPVIIWYLIFCYLPMVGLYMSFTNFVPGKGLMGLFQGDFVGLKWFLKFFESPYAFRLIRNTFLMAFFSLIFGFPIPIIFAICITQIRSKPMRQAGQVLTYLPYFISTVVVCGMINNFLSPSTGIINQIIEFFGGTPINFLGLPEWFRAIYVVSGSWQTFGFNSIIFVAAIMAIPQDLYEAMRVDGANKRTIIWHLVLPSIKPTVVLLLIMACGNLMSVGFEKVYLLYSPGVYETADVISTYVYRQGIESSNYSYAAAVGLFNSLVTFAIVFVANRASRKLTDTSVW